MANPTIKAGYPVRVTGSFSATIQQSVTLAAGEALLVLGATDRPSSVISNVKFGTTTLNATPASNHVYGAPIQAFWLSASEVTPGTQNVVLTCGDNSGKPFMLVLVVSDSEGGNVTLSNAALQGTVSALNFVAGSISSQAGATVFGMVMNDAAAKPTEVAGTTSAYHNSTAGYAMEVWTSPGAASVSQKATYAAPLPGITYFGVSAMSSTGGSGGNTDVAPTISTQPASQSVVTGATATFSVVAAGTPAPTYQWQRNGTNISGAVNASYTTPATTVSGGSANNGDTFRCVVTNSAGSVTSDSAALTVAAGNSAPTVTSQPSSLTVNTGATATFSASFAGTPTPTYQWQRNGADIAGANSSSYTTPATAVSGGNANNGDVYRCVATNSSGSVTTNGATLSVVVGTGATVNLSGADKVLTNNLGMRWANAQVKLSFQRADNDQFVVAKTITTDSSGSCGNVNDAALTAGVTYDIKFTHVASGGKGLYTVVAQ